MAGPWGLPCRSSPCKRFPFNERMRKLSAYRRGEWLFVSSSSETTAGVWISAEPCVRLPVTCSDEELGEAVGKALDGSRTGVPHPTNWNTLPDPLLNAAGLRSWSRFSRGAVSVDVREVDGKLTLTPLKNLGPREGFVAADVGDLFVSLSAGSAEIGCQLRSAFALAA